VIDLSLCTDAGSRLLQAKLKGGLERSERVEGKIHRLSEIVSTPPTEGVWITELPSLKAMAKLKLLVAVYRTFMNISRHYAEKLISHVRSKIQ